MYKNLYVIIAVVAVLLTGCSTKPTSVEDLSEVTPPPDKATLIAENDAWGRALVPMQVQKNSNFVTLNGEKLSTFTNSVTEMTIDPGEHALEVSCSFRRGTALHLTNNVPIQMYFEVQTVYFFRVVLENGTCGVEVGSS